MTLLPFGRRGAEPHGGRRAASQDLSVWRLGMGNAEAVDHLIYLQTYFNMQNYLIWEITRYD
jgi:hypothetical protein